VKVSVQLPTHRIDDFDELCGIDAVTELSREAEAAGFDAVFVTEHPMPGDAWLATGGHHALDPFVTLAVVAGATSRLRLQTNLCIPAYRNPFLLAKAVASLDALSGGRVILGVGAGYLEEEFAALGVDFAERNELTDESLRAMHAAWSGESVVMRGRHFDAIGNTALPTPARAGGPPLWIGGNARRAMRRAVELGSGWAPMPSPARARRRLHTPGIESLDELRVRIEELQGMATAAGRSDPLDIVFMPMGLDMFTNAPVDPGSVVDSIAALGAVGVTYATTTVPGETRSELLASLATFGEEILPVVASI
jgi:probable F420-dependent oxidoreductase